ncbi:MAG: tetratricopeptide repeat protein [Myxococcota bacterium]|nr:tetratricopeptide repeat protein [Myxococcota bacterium]
MNLLEGIRLYQRKDYLGAVGILKPLMMHSPNAEIAYYLASTYMALSDHQQAKELYKKAISLRNDFPEALINQAICEQHLGELFQAEQTLQTLLTHSPQNPLGTLNLGALLYEQGRPEEAISYLKVATEHSPQRSEGWFNLGASFLAIGREEESLRCLKEAIDCDPHNQAAYIEMAYAQLSGAPQSQAQETLETLISLNPKHSFARYILAVLSEKNQDFEGAMEHFKHLSFQQYAPWIDSWQFVQESMDDDSVMLGSTASGFRNLQNLTQLDGLCIELGVRFGNSLRLLQKYTQKEWHGFDTFQGLPTNWHELPQGSYSTGGHIPALGDKIRLYPGRFTYTLPEFIPKKEGPISILHVDCDLYESTYDALCLLNMWIRPGTIIIFDEFLMNEHWRQDEYKAWIECAQKFGWKAKYVSYSLFSGQVVLQITSTQR